jgi:pimeloyl-ACP methyl ester carboxylesterase
MSVVSLHVGTVDAAITNATKTIIPAYEITTRGNLFKAQGVSGSGYLNSYQLLDIKNLSNTCPDEVAIFVHGWGQNEAQAKERFDRVKMSLENNSYKYPFVGFSWDSDTEWIAAKFIAKWNGPKLADFIVSLMDHCKQNNDKVMKIRLISHSLGARVILSALDSLHKSPIWNANNFKIASVDLLGAAVDDEEVTTNPKYILEDKTNWGSPKSDYGQAIEEEVVTFSNLYSSKDNVLEPHPETSLPIYPLFESDSALGQGGHQKGIELPNNFNDTNDINVTNEIKAIKDADGLDAEVFGLCNNDNTYCNIKKQGWDLGLCNLLVVPPYCQKDIGLGDNHAGYIGFRIDNKSLLADSGAIDVVVSHWK